MIHSVASLLKTQRRESLDPVVRDLDQGSDAWGSTTRAGQNTVTNLLG
jgi:hypothetical protein